MSFTATGQREESGTCGEERGFSPTDRAAAAAPQGADETKRTRLLPRCEKAEGYPIITQTFNINLSYFYF